jgi:glycosyltransferase involved in cell wall biosynthesis
LLIEDRVWATGIKKIIGNFMADWAVSATASADLTITVDDWVKPLTAKNRIVIHNAPDSRFLPEPSELDAKPRAIYVGDVRTSRGLFSMLRAIEMTDDWTLDVIGNVAANDLAQLQKWKTTSAAANRVRFHGNLSPKDSWNFAKGAWVGLALLHPTPAFNRAWPTKVGEYIACGLPVIGTDLPRIAEVVLKDPRPGALVETVNSEVIAMQTAGILNSWGENPDEFKEVRDRALLNVEQWRSAAGYDRIAREISALIQ